MKILFLLKKNMSSGGYNGTNPKAGLFNSASFLAERLNKVRGIETKLEVCIDSNGIDKEVHLYKPDLCILEALWVTKEKLSEIINLHPNTYFVIRIHSKIPFLANEGIAIERIKDFDNMDVTISFNEQSTSENFEGLDIFNAYLPNIYRDFYYSPISAIKYAKLVAQMIASTSHPLRKYFKRQVINIGCFGAIRPMKNQLLQAVVAIQFAREHGLVLNFHINGTRSEQGGGGALKNLRSLFEGENDVFLVEHSWLPHNEFLTLIRSMDIGMQVSFSESFNIVAADFVSQGIPIIVSEEVEWMPAIAKARETDVKHIKSRLLQAMKNKELYSELSKMKLIEYNKKAMEIWLDFI